jgi:L-lactate dehydrogenase complex protein LldG
MATGRERILGDIRRSLGRGALSADAGRELGARLKAHKANLIPARAKGSAEERVALFVAMAEGADATVARVADAAGVPAAVAEYLAEHNLPTRLVAAPDKRLDAMPWEERPLLELRRGAAEESDAVSLTPAFAGIAETGTLMLTSGAETPTTLNFLPETHVVVVSEAEIVGAYEEAWTRLRKARRQGRGWSMPRTVNMITGPSRSGDIGLTLYLGAHGPRRLHIVLVGEGG